MTTATAPITVTLTPRLYEIMRLKLDGRSNVEIAARLYTSVNTVKIQVSLAYDRCYLAGWEPTCGQRQLLQQLTVAIARGQIRLVCPTHG